MKDILIYNYVLMLTVLLCSYYILGGHSFPDYQAYNLIAYSDFGGDDGYFTEFLSRYILYNGLFEGFNRVDQLALFVQLFFIVSTLFIIFKDSSKLYTVLVFVAFFSPLLITTVLRVSPLYLLFFYFSIFHIKDVVKLKHIICLGGLGSLFHDSFFLVVITLFIIWIVQKREIKISNKVLSISLLASICLIFISPQLKPLILVYMDKTLLGARSVYIDEDGFSIIKISFVIVLNLITISLINDRDVNLNAKITAFILVIATNIIFLVGSTAGIRFSIFSYAYVIATRGVLLFKFEGSNSHNQIICSFLLFPLLFLRLFILL
jgi:hypothetical protein